MGRCTEEPEEAFVREVLAARFRVELRKLPKSNVRTADFELLLGGERAAVLEVKHLDRVPRTSAHGWTVVEEEDGVRQAEREDNAPTRVGAAIHEAWKQLRNYVEPKILVFVNDERLIDVLDLHEAFDGFLEYGHDETAYLNTASAKIAQGRIREEKALIDLYVWIDRHNGSEPMFRMTTRAGLEIGQRFFGSPAELAS